jgi:ubiquinone/menaquinone biosynthesis C-methylase UbiE
MLTPAPVEPGTQSGSGRFIQEERMTWQAAGEAWGARAADWAYLMEPLFAGVYAQLSTSSRVAAGTRVLDMGCGAGSALAVYERAGAKVAGLDASEALLAIAQARVPHADLRRGSMSALPWDDASFDVVTGINAFVYADDGALAQARRVMTNTGTLGLGFFRDPGDFGPCMLELGRALEAHGAPQQTHTPLKMADPDHTRAALEQAGFALVDSGEVISVGEFPDVDIAYRALASTGNMFPVTRAGEEEPLRARCESILGELMDDVLGIRMRASFGWITARPI